MLRYAAKAVVAAVVAGLTAAISAVADGSGVSTYEALGIALATVVAAGAVYGISNG